MGTDPSDKVTIRFTTDNVCPIHLLDLYETFSDQSISSLDPGFFTGEPCYQVFSLAHPLITFSQATLIGISRRTSLLSIQPSGTHISLRLSSSGFAIVFAEDFEETGSAIKPIPSSCMSLRIHGRAH